MKTFQRWVIGSALVLSMGGALATYHESIKSHAPKAGTHEVSKKEPSWLFVVSAEKAKLKRDKEGKQLLVIKNSDLDKVIEFSDRPYRYVHEISGGELKMLWADGKNSFEVDPPNAVLSGANHKPQIVILNGMQRNAQDTTFKITIHKNVIKGNNAMEMDATFNSKSQQLGSQSKIH